VGTCRAIILRDDCTIIAQDNRTARAQKKSFFKFFLSHSARIFKKKLSLILGTRRANMLRDDCAIIAQDNRTARAHFSKQYYFKLLSLLCLTSLKQNLVQYVHNRMKN